VSKLEVRLQHPKFSKTITPIVFSITKLVGKEYQHAPVKNSKLVAYSRKG